MKTPLTESEKRYSVIMVGENHGLVYPLGTSHESSPEHYERTEMCRADFARQLEIAKNESWQEVLDWEQWAKEVCEDFRIPFDNHKVGLRIAITQWMADRMRSNAALCDAGGQ